MHWIKFTANTRHLIHVSLANAMSVIWNEKENASYIAFPGGREEVLVVIETGEKKILKGRRLSELTGRVAEIDSENAQTTVC